MASEFRLTDQDGDKLELFPGKHGPILTVSSLLTDTALAFELDKPNLEELIHQLIIELGELS